MNSITYILWTQRGQEEARHPARGSASKLIAVSFWRNGGTDCRKRDLNRHFTDFWSWRVQKTSNNEISTELLLRHFQTMRKQTGVVGCWEAPEVQLLCSCSVGTLRTWVYSCEARSVYLRVWAFLFCSLLGLFLTQQTIQCWNVQRVSHRHPSICCCFNAFFSESVCLGLVLVDRLVIAMALKSSFAIIGCEWSADAKVAIWELAWAESISNAELCRGATTKGLVEQQRSVTVAPCMPWFLKMPCMGTRYVGRMDRIVYHICRSPNPPIGACAATLCGATHVLSRRSVIFFKRFSPMKILRTLEINIISVLDCCK